MSFTFSLSDPQLNPLQLSAIANPSRRPAEPQIRPNRMESGEPLRPKTSHPTLKSPTLSPMGSRLFHRRDKLGRDQRNALNGTTDHLVDQRQKKHVEDAFISSQLVELGLLDPRHAIGKRGAQMEGGYKKSTSILLLCSDCYDIIAMRLDMDVQRPSPSQAYEGLHAVNAAIFPSNHARQIFGVDGIQREALRQRSSVGI